jgi:rare lipoprotein A
VGLALLSFICLALPGLVGGCSLVTRPLPPDAGPGPAPGAPGGTGTAVGAVPSGTIAPGWTEEGVASWYGNPFHGRQTASGETYDMEAPTAAHQSLPFGTVVQVENLNSGATTTLRINDRGPFVGGRILDVSRRGARELGLLGPGTGPVRITVLEAPEPQRCWQVQVGAFGERANAEAARARLESRGIPARVVDAGGGLYRVIAGPWNERPPAAELARRDGGIVIGC